MGSLEGKVAIITGGARGIGRAVAITFAHEKADLAIFDLDAEESSSIQDLKKALSVYGGKCLYVKADVTHAGEVGRAVEKTIQNLRKVDILVNNAGGGMAPVPLEDLKEQDWDRVVNANLKGTYFCTQAVVSYMKRQGSGQIINIASQAGRSRSELCNVSYSSAKAGIIGFTRQLAFEVGAYGVHVNAIAPGVILSGERVAKRWEERPEEEKRKMLEAIPLKRLGKPEEIARVALFLASADSSYITGATIDVNGGRFMM